MLSSIHSGNSGGAPSSNAYTGPNIPAYYSLSNLLRGVVRTVSGSGVSGARMEKAPSGQSASVGVAAADFWSGLSIDASGKIESMKNAEVSGYTGQI
jgi:hypothetical protein